MSEDDGEYVEADSDDVSSSDDEPADGEQFWVYDHNFSRSARIR